MSTEVPLTLFTFDMGGSGARRGCTLSLFEKCDPEKQQVREGRGSQGAQSGYALCLQSGDRGTVLSGRGF